MPKTTTKKKTKKTIRKPKPKTPLWKGPEEDGVTQSLLGSFLCCRERFRLKVVEGLTEADNFNHSIEYGNMWHICEEALAAQHSPVVTDGTGWQSKLKKYCNELLVKYPLAKDQITKWYEVCKLQFPIYVEYWRKHPDVRARTPLLQEETFCVPYELPSGRIVKLRGKWDSVDIIGKRNKAGIWRQENKTKGEIKEEQLVRQLTFDLQTMLYLIALHEHRKLSMDNKSILPSQALIKGVRYNVIRRPLSGGKGSIKPLKGTIKKPPETMPHYYDRLRGIIEEEPEHYFMRWQVVITPADIERFKRECLNPILEQLCEWWDYLHLPDGTLTEDPFFSSTNFRLPYGVYNPMSLGFTTELDEYLASGSTIGLEKTDNLFPELD